MALEILYRDADLAVVNKPSGVVVHRGWADDDDDLMRALRDQLGLLVYPIHRLDRGASGAVVFALHRDAARQLGALFSGDQGDASVEKRYLALVRGHPPEQGVIDHPIPSKPDGPRVPARTEFRRLGTFERYALVEATPRTGRLHQIRRHLKHIACPLIGDVNYGKGEHNRLFRERYGLHRLALHAHLLAFPHPATGAAIAPLVIRAPLRGELAACLEAIGLAAAVPQTG
jgi:tRNA pseudouridine65 synthase